MVSFSKGKLVILILTLLFFSPGKENDLGKGRIWTGLGSLCQELENGLNQLSNSHWVLTEHSLFMLGIVEETVSLILKLPYSAIRDKVSIYNRVSIVHGKY